MRYSLLAPIAIMTAISLYFSYDFLSGSISSNDLSRAIKEQYLYKSVIRELIDEQDVSLKYTRDVSDANKKLLDVSHKATDGAVQQLLKYLPQNSDQDAQLLQKIDEIRANVQDLGIHQDALFFSFFERINNTMLQSYIDYEDDDINERLKLLIISLRSIYSHLSAINISRAHIAQALQNKETLTQENIRKWLEIDSINIFNAEILPKSEAKNRVITLLNSELVKQMMQNFDELRARLLNNKNDEISNEDIISIDLFEEQKYMLLLEISDIIEQYLSEQNDIIHNKKHIGFVVCLVLSIWFLYCWFKINSKLKLAQGLKEQIDHIKLSILEPADEPQNEQKTLETFIGLYKELFKSHLRLKKFNDIKNIHLNKLVSGYKQRYDQNLQNLNFLRAVFAAIDQNRAIDALEQSLSTTIVSLEGVDNLIKIEDNDLRLNLATFDPQTMFKSALEAQISQTTAKKIDFTTFIDPYIDYKLEGDEQKIRQILSNVLNSAIWLCNQYAHITVYISSTVTAGKDIATLNVSVKNDADALSRERIGRFLDINKEPQDANEPIYLWLALANMQLSFMNSKLQITSQQGLGNEFSFKITLKINGKLELPSVDKKLKIGVVSDANVRYNEFLALSLERLGVEFETISSLKKLAEPERFSFILMRENKDSELENAIALKDPLTPLGLLQRLCKDPSTRYLQKFIASRPQILIFEPNYIILQMVKSAFERYNVELTLYSQTKGLLDTLTHKKFDIAFIDAQSKNPELINKIQNAINIGQNTNMPTVGMSSNTSELSEKEILQRFDAHIKKPLVGKILRTILDKFIPNMKDFIKTGALSKSQNILIYKKSEIENKIFAAALAEFSAKIVAANSFETLSEQLAKNTFGIVLVDEGVHDFNAEALLAMFEQARENFGIDMRLFIFSNQTQNFNAKEYVKTLSPRISKAQLINVVKDEISRRRA